MKSIEKYGLAAPLLDLELVGDNSPNVIINLYNLSSVVPISENVTDLVMNNGTTYRLDQEVGNILVEISQVWMELQDDFAESIANKKREDLAISTFPH